VFASVHPRFHTPHIAIITHAIVCGALAITGSFGGLAVLATVSTLILYLLCCVAAWVLRARDVRTDSGIPFRLPGGPVIPLLAIAVIVWLLSSASVREFVIVGGVAFAATLLYAVSGARRRPRQERVS
jgi:amino acid transporter